MDKTMKAAVARAFGKPLAIEEVAVPRPGPGELLVKIEACGVCHTDLHAAEGDWPVRPTLPFIPGHEGVGVVAAVGAGVTTVREGDRVGVPWLHSACGHCVHCLGGWETLCESQQNTGYSVNGGFAEYALAHPAFVGHIPDGLDFVEVRWLGTLPHVEEIAKDRRRPLGDHPGELVELEFDTVACAGVRLGRGCGIGNLPAALLGLGVLKVALHRAKGTPLPDEWGTSSGEISLS